MNNFRNSQLIQWFTNNDPENNLLSWHRKKRAKALEERDKLIWHTARKLWEEDGEPENRGEYYWQKAIEKLKSETTSAILFSQLVRIGYGIEKPLEKGLAFLKTLAILEILGILGNITIAVAIISFTLTEKQRRDSLLLKTS